MIEIATSAFNFVLSASKNELIEFAVESYNKCRRHNADDYTTCRQYLEQYAEPQFVALINTCSDIDKNLLSVAIQYVIGGNR